MSDLALLIDQDGATLDANDGDVLTLRSVSGDVSRVGTRAIDSVVLDADATVSTRALLRMARHGVALIVVGRGRQAGVHWTQPGATGARLRHLQHLAVHEADSRLRLARPLLCAKLEAQIAMLESLPGTPVPSVLATAPARLAQARDLPTLRGIEGAAARAYWAAWGRQWPAAWGFAGRNRRPPGDPVNALLSLGYTLATGEATRQVALTGLDPWLGVLHETRPPAAALALDVVEAARALVDAWVVQLVQRLSLTPADFARQIDGGMSIAADRRRDVYVDWFASGLPQVRREIRDKLKGLSALLATFSPAALTVESIADHGGYSDD